MELEKELLELVEAYICNINIIENFSDIGINLEGSREPGNIGHYIWNINDILIKQIVKYLIKDGDISKGIDNDKFTELKTWMINDLAYPVDLGDFNIAVKDFYDVLCTDNK